nr:unnamed protein product [Spirometra erinaceieuropaei]
MTEKIGGAEGTKLDEEYVNCEKVCDGVYYFCQQIDIMAKLIEEIINRTHEYLQPNPATRAKMVTMNTFNKIQGKAKTSAYPQPEGQLGDCMLKYGDELGSDSLFGECLVQAGQSFKCLEEIKFHMEDQVKTGYIEPLRGIQTVELKEINFHRKKLEGRRLDYDCKKRRKENNPAGGKVIEDEVKIAEEKFQESKMLAETAMVNFLSSDEPCLAFRSSIAHSKATWCLIEPLKPKLVSATSHSRLPSALTKGNDPIIRLERVGVTILFTIDLSIWP